MYPNDTVIQKLDNSDVFFQTDLNVLYEFDVREIVFRIFLVANSNSSFYGVCHSFSQSCHTSTCTCAFATRGFQTLFYFDGFPYSYD